MYSHINLKTDKLIAVKTYVRIDENINQRVFNEEEQVRYSATPMFTVVVEKK